MKLFNLVDEAKGPRPRDFVFEGAIDQIDGNFLAGNRRLIEIDFESHRKHIGGRQFRIAVTGGDLDRL